MKGAEMNSTRLNFVPLQHASLCMDCDLITDAHTRCLVCGSAALLSVAKALNGDESADYSPVMGSTVIKRHSRQTQLSKVVCKPERRTHHASYGELVVFPQIAGIHDHNEPKIGSGGLRRSFRDVAALVHRAMTIAIIVAALFAAGGKIASSRAKVMRTSSGVLGLRIASIIHLVDGIDGMPTGNVVMPQRNSGLEGSALMVPALQNDALEKAIRYRGR
jgi:hypothetical protein